MIDRDTTSIIVRDKTKQQKQKKWVWAFNELFFFLKKKKSLAVLEYIQCPAMVLLCVSLMRVMWFLSLNAILAPEAVTHSLTLPGRRLYVCFYVCVHELLSPSALAAYSLPLSLLFTLFVFLFMSTCYPHPCSGNETPPLKNTTDVGCLAKLLEGASVAQ